MDPAFAWNRAAWSIELLVGAGTRLMNENPKCNKLNWESKSVLLTLFWPNNGQPIFGEFLIFAEDYTAYEIF